MKRAFSIITSSIALATVFFIFLLQFYELFNPVHPASVKDIFGEYALFNTPSLIAIPLAVYNLFKPSIWINILLIIFILFVLVPALALFVLCATVAGGGISCISLPV